MRDKRILFGLLTLLASGLIAAGCGGNDNGGDGSGDGGSGDGGSIQDLTTPEGVDEALENLPETVDEAVALCKEAVDASGLSGGEKDEAIKQCEEGGQQAQDALENGEINPEDLGAP